MFQIFTRLRALVKSGEAAKVGVGATEAARALGMAPALAKEQLLAAESQGLFFTIWEETFFIIIQVLNR